MTRTDICNHGECIGILRPIAGSTDRVCEDCGTLAPAASSPVAPTPVAETSTDPRKFFNMGRVFGEQIATKLLCGITGMTPEELHARIDHREPHEPPAPVNPVAPAIVPPQTTQPAPVVASDIDALVMSLRDAMVAGVVRSARGPELSAEAIWTAAILATFDLQSPGGPALWAAHALLASAGDEPAAQTVLRLLVLRMQQGGAVSPSAMQADLPPMAPQSMPRVVGPTVVPNTASSRPRQPGETPKVQPKGTPGRARWTPRVIQGGRVDAEPSHHDTTPPDTNPQDIA